MCHSRQSMADVHMTELVAQVTDQWYHPLPGYDITVSSLNTTAGTIVGPANGVTDSNGEFYTQFRLGDVCNGTGTVNVQSRERHPVLHVPDHLHEQLVPERGHDHHAPQRVSQRHDQRGHIHQGPRLEQPPQPVDMMLITDRSGSMDWYSTYVYPPMVTRKQAPCRRHGQGLPGRNL